MKSHFGIYIADVVKCSNPVIVNVVEHHEMGIHVISRDVVMKCLYIYFRSYDPSPQSIGRTYFCHSWSSLVVPSNVYQIQLWILYSEVIYPLKYRTISQVIVTIYDP